MTIRHKLYSLGVIAILGIVTLLGTSSHFADQSQELNHAIKLVGDLEIRLLNLRRNEKTSCYAATSNTSTSSMETSINLSGPNKNCLAS